MFVGLAMIGEIPIKSSAENVLEFSSIAKELKITPKKPGKTHELCLISISTIY
jgi:hypothetical protein